MPIKERMLMSINFIELLRQKVSAIVLEGETTYLVEKSDALAQFYPVLLAILKARPELIPSLENQLNPTLNELFGHHVALKEQFLNQVSGSIPHLETERILNQSITPTMAVLIEEAGSPDPEAIRHLLYTHQDIILAVLPHWAMALLAGLGINPAAGETLYQAPREPDPVIIEDRRTNLLWPLIGIVVLAILAALMLRACDDDQETDQQAVVNGTQPAYFQLTTGDEGELITCQIRISDLKYVDILQGEVKYTFSHPTGCGVDTQSIYHASFMNQDALPSVLKIVQGVPNSSITWTGKEINIQSSRNGDAQSLVSQIRLLVPDMTITTQQLVASNPQPTHAGVTDAERTLSQINPDNIKPLDIATALNLEVIHFASGSAQVPDVNKPILDQAAALLQRVPNVVVTVKGHTDAEGSEAVNNNLSVQRAQAVVNYLVSRGVSPSKLQALGYGQDQPVTDNATSQGKFQNRRIEFEILNTDTGVVREVNEQGVKPAS